MRFHTTAGLAFDELALDRLPLFIRGAGELPKKLYEQLLANCSGMVVRPQGGKDPWHERYTASRVSGVAGSKTIRRCFRKPGGRFTDTVCCTSTFPFRSDSCFVELCDLQKCNSQMPGNRAGDHPVLLNRSVSGLDSAVDKDCFLLNCSPVVNVFEKSADRIHINRGEPEFHVLPDRTRPLDFEVYSVEEVHGIGASAEDNIEFRKFYSDRETIQQDERMAYYTSHRVPRKLSTKQRQVGSRASYSGSEVYLSLVDARAAPYAGEIKQLSIRTTCTNRDLPLQIPIGKGVTDFTLEAGAPVEAIRCVAGPTRPRPSQANGNASWKLISHLSLNYLSLIDSNEEDGATALRELLFPVCG